MIITDSAFKAYDIRGIVGKELSDDFAYALGRAYASFCKKKNLKTITVGYDARNSSPGYEKQIVQAIRESGLTAVRIGLVSTPIVYYTVFSGKYDAGIMITASHNPPEYNGFKMVFEKRKMTTEEIQKIKEMMKKEDFVSGRGRIKDYDAEGAYRKYAKSKLNSKRKLKVVTDSGNGTAGVTAPKLYRALGYDVHELFSYPDGNFPNHHPDPTKTENLKDLQKEVRKQKADVGIAFDGDADRVAIVDDLGNAYWGDSVLMFICNDLLTKPMARVGRFKNPAIVFDLKCSMALKEEIGKLGGKPIEWKTGHINIQSKMREEDAILGGEMSGHIFFNDHYLGFDDAIYSGARILEILSGASEPLSKLIPKSPYKSTPEIRMESSGENKFSIVNDALAQVKKKKLKYTNIDGVKVSLEKGWFLIRASNTQSEIVFRAEAKTESDLESLKKEAGSILKKAYGKYKENMQGF